MQESEFNSRVESTLETLELALDVMADELDYETSGGVLTVTFENDTSMVFSRQLGNHQLWVAARSGGYHFSYDEAAGDWRCTRSGDLFSEFVTTQMREQAGVEFSF
ncbi:iron donor protein CyaY [Halieaceae bacterium IMCC14734]|uniref:Iron-sulfur cluster assembly protein CyaY n=1 Tax=Candidatus Litorirhabdus singularis TaxID=2518993 RepID=A0ABT3TB81_9GAMM|nr:iron donor protein CyaY [Candidatus Litorirhabdus singularis]MCX2979526.1 iron donor protein CyaY [Candidatus Litorirhabdus singularis]